MLSVWQILVASLVALAILLHCSVVILTILAIISQADVRTTHDMAISAMRASIPVLSAPASAGVAGNKTAAIFS